MTEQQEMICEAIESCEGSYFSSAQENRIAVEFGDEVADAARQLYDDTIGCVVDWSKISMDEGLGVLADTCDEKYPWLTEAARNQIVHWFIMAWK